MTIDQKIDAVLKIFSDQMFHAWFESCDKALNVDSREDDIKHEILKEEMIKKLGLVSTEDDRVFQITAEGLRITELGGWVKYNEAKARMLNKLSRKESWRHRANFILGAFSILAATYSIYLSDKSSKLEQQIETLTKEKSETSKRIDSYIQDLKDLQKILADSSHQSVKK